MHGALLHRNKRRIAALHASIPLELRQTMGRAFHLNNAPLSVALVTHVSLVLRYPVSRALLNPNTLLGITEPTNITLMLRLTVNRANLHRNRLRSGAESACGSLVKNITMRRTVLHRELTRGVTLHAMLTLKLCHSMDSTLTLRNAPLRVALVTHGSLMLREPMGGALTHIHGTL